MSDTPWTQTMIEWVKANWFITLLMLTLTSLFIYLYLFTFVKPLSGKTIVNPFTNQLKATCSTTRTLCDPTIQNQCDTLCDDVQEMQCVNMDALNPTNASGQKANAGGYVCLPSQPDVSCNQQNGGASIWTGYGFTEQQDWSCLCTQPDLFHGQHCEVQNPALCSGGTFDITKVVNGSAISGCTCPAGTKMMVNQQTNLPFCVSTNPPSSGGGGGANGLYGNISSFPSWENIYFNPNTSDSDNYATWAARIADEMYPSRYIGPEQLGAITTVLKNSTQGGKITTQLTQSIQNTLCANGNPKIPLLNRTSLCSKPFPASVDNKVKYTYFDEELLDN